MRASVRTSCRIGIAAILFTVTTTACARNGQSGGASSSTPASGDASVATVTEGFGPSVRQDIETLRNATAPFHDVKVAQAAGYPTTVPGCVADSTMGGMGRHYFDRAVFDEKLNISHPEMLIYAPAGAGKPDKLVGVEYVIPFKLLPSTEKPPRLFGQELRRHEDFKYWYLHVWAWTRNSAGLFADWNPAITCSPK